MHAYKNLKTLLLMSYGGEQEYFNFLMRNQTD